MPSSLQILQSTDARTPHPPPHRIRRSRTCAAHPRISLCKRRPESVRAFLLPIVAVLALISACDVDCFDDAELEASYREGEQAAVAANAAHYDEGRVAGLSLTKQDGERDGLYEGYDDGYGTGYGHAFPIGYNDGYSRGHTEGYLDPAACSDGSSDGFDDGDYDGYEAGYDDAHADGYDVGYGVGYDTGLETCGGEAVAARTDAAPADDAKKSDDEKLCYRRGFEKIDDPTSYDRGLAEGKRLNPDYQAGYQSTYPAAFDRGDRDGTSAGYSDGWNEGFASGYAEGYAIVYDGCYASSYSTAFDDAYEDGWDDGWGSGWDSGYAAGYSDGADCD